MYPCGIRFSRFEKEIVPGERRLRSVYPPAFHFNRVGRAFLPSPGVGHQPNSRRCQMSKDCVDGLLGALTVLFTLRCDVEASSFVEGSDRVPPESGVRSRRAIHSARREADFGDAEHTAKL